VYSALAIPVAAELPGPFLAQRNAPYAVVLGTAQDAGVPQVNCFNANCNAVRSGQRPAPRVASVGVVDAAAGKRFIFDATPDFVAQVGDLLSYPVAGTPELAGSVRLEEQLHGIFLTHGHMGHYTGLVHCGREGAATRDLPLYVSPSMASYLGNNEPWSFLLRNRHVRAVELEPGVSVQLTDAVSVTPFEVLHRQELTDTLGFLIHGASVDLMYVPDADRWEDWPVPFDQWFARSDVALLDGSFFSHDELGHRPQGDVPHPPVVDSMELLGTRLDGREVWFIHLNNTNPLWDPASPQTAAVRAAGFDVAQQGQRVDL
jgi:pyrroloquinoline quinone biosynthesis protein B